MGFMHQSHAIPCLDGGQFYEDPVCGRDGETYPSRCDADVLMFSVLHGWPAMLKTLVWAQAVPQESDEGRLSFG